MSHLYISRIAETAAAHTSLELHRIGIKPTDIFNGSASTIAFEIESAAMGIDTTDGKRPRLAAVTSEEATIMRKARSLKDRGLPFMHLLGGE